MELLFNIFAWLFMISLIVGFIGFIIEVAKGFSDEVHGRNRGCGLPWL